MKESEYKEIKQNANDILNELKKADKEKEKKNKINFHLKLIF